MPLKPSDIYQNNDTELVLMQILKQTGLYMVGGKMSESPHAPGSLPLPLPVNHPCLDKTPVGLLGIMLCVQTH